MNKGLVQSHKRIRSEIVQPKAFRRWRKSLGLSQKEAAEALGLKRRVVQYYEKGEREGERIEIPKSVRLACYALSAGVRDYHGPPADADGKASVTGGEPTHHARHAAGVGDE